MEKQVSVGKVSDKMETLELGCGGDSCHVGKVFDKMETLEKLCNEKAEQMAKTMTMNNGESQEVAFWTGDIPELICVGRFVKGNDGKTTYNLDFSQSTL